MRHRVTGLEPTDVGWRVVVDSPSGRDQIHTAADLICSLPPQCLLDLIPEAVMPRGYRQRLSQLPEPSGALVLYGAVRREALPSTCPGHLQRGADDPGSLFVSISREGDGRAPTGQATVIASVFTPTADWCSLEEEPYQARKSKRLNAMRRELNHWLDLQPQDWLHVELATPGDSPVGPVARGAWWGDSASTRAVSGPSGWQGGHRCRPLALRRQPPSRRRNGGRQPFSLNACRQLVAARGGELQLRG